MKLLSVAVLAMATVAISAAAGTDDLYASLSWTPVKLSEPAYPTAVNMARYCVEVTNQYHSLKSKLAGKGYKDGIDYSYDDVKEVYRSEDDKATYYKMSVYCKYGSESYTYDYTIEVGKDDKPPVVRRVKHNDDLYEGYYDRDYSFGGRYKHMVKVVKKDKDHEYEYDGGDDDHFDNLACNMFRSQPVGGILVVLLFGSPINSFDCKLVDIKDVDYYKDGDDTYYCMTMGYYYSGKQYSTRVTMYTPYGHRKPKCIVHVGLPGYAGEKYCDDDEPEYHDKSRKLL